MATFTQGDRVTDPDGRTGTVIGMDHIPAYTHGVTGDLMPSELWIEYKLDNGQGIRQIDSRKLRKSNH